MRAVIMSIVVLSGLLVGVTGCPYQVPLYDYSQEPDPRNKELVLGVGDTIAINVWENRDLNTETTIRADGTITMPLVGDLKAAGETPSALKGQIAKRIVEFVKLAPGNSELVTVAVKAWKSYRFTLQGEVVRQGVFTSDQFVTVSDAIAMAGGLTRFAKRAEVKLFRADPKTKEVRTIPLDYDALSSGKRLDMNIYVLAGDTIYVP
ncbi:MAG: polysaccharide export protein [Deltaproteobacteria bacterium]|nr:polysaccharide export protein [Deltaproteobacteria bacterium]